ncbi:ASCH domain-containing protein [Anaerobacillus sp. CMMVII]|uniref:ASCH domain-containing protein n=1 Tax=Anaerobacillus sp. CMMVII TaxID=2755588 RepID=UPI0021B78F4D|nr:ASCH domain-containing protein [Anaerobacillus sp. CMMVII]MCT8138326.1 ASCH domain-containing protein [Anaerobacillus sp. CMMVII]
MLHKMGLSEEPFQSIKSGKKIVEVRLNDDKRRKIEVGDTIEFLKVPEEKGTLTAKVLQLRTYDTFLSMYKDIPFSDFDCEGWTMEEMIKGTYEIYTPEQEEKWGTLAITLEKITLD